MKKIYIILTFTGTALSRIIKLSTKDEFAHASIALDSELKEMYSFGRLNPYNPFFGGFVHEGIDHGTFKRFAKTTTSNVYSLDVTDYQYKKIKKEIKNISNYRDNYRFNVLGLVFAKFRKKLNREDCYYCAEFVKKVMDDACIETNLPECIKPEDFKYLDNTTLLFSGMLRDYKIGEVNE